MATLLIFYAGPKSLLILSLLSDGRCISNVGGEQGLKMSGSAGSGAARKLLPANPHRKFVTISQEIFRVESPMLCKRLD